MNNRLVDAVFFTDERGGADGGLFKGIFIRYLAQLAREGDLPLATKTQYEDAIRSSMLSMYNRGMNQATHMVNTNWDAKPGASTDFSTQLSGIMLAEAASSLDRVYVYKNANYSGRLSSLTPGSYTLTQLSARRVLDDDITSITIPAGMTVTAYADDNFAGSNAIFASSIKWLANWNDRISSLRVSQ